MKLRNTINSVRYAVLYAGPAALLAPVLTMAQESTSTTGPITTSGSDWSATYNVGTLTSVNSAADGLREMFGKILGTLVPVIGAVILAGVAVWAMPKIVGIIKSAFQTSKGR